ncbi:hypothetical protein [Frankia sp. Allo2]|nr:hypothetical protein [Frankia sp. Allo2]
MASLATGNDAQADALTLAATWSSTVPSSARAPLPRLGAATLTQAADLP